MPSSTLPLLLLLSIQGGEIRATAFNEVADKFFNVFEHGHVYYISGGKLTPARKQYSHLKNDYEIRLGHETNVQPCEEDQGRCGVAW